MLVRATVLLVLALAVVQPVSAQNDDCISTRTHYGIAINGEVAGSRQYAESLGYGWTFQLAPAPHGWVINVLDEDGYNLALATLPIYGDTNPRYLYGWHFRNGANTGPNEGDVNAPQLERRFTLNDPRTGAVRGMGLGWLNILDFGLADLTAGQRARMVYLKFAGCVLVPKTEEEQRHDDNLASPEYIDEEMEEIRSCELPLAYYPQAWVMPRIVNGDFDGDDAHDFAVPIVRAADSKRGIAVCRAGTWISVFGFDEVPPGSGLVPGYFDLVEAWSTAPRDEVTQYVGDRPLPEGPGDVITIERIEKSAYSIYWDDADFASHHHYTFVEP